MSFVGAAGWGADCGGSERATRRKWEGKGGEKSTGRLWAGERARMERWDRTLLGFARLTPPVLAGSGSFPSRTYSGSAVLRTTRQ